MITSESTCQEIRRFFNSHSRELNWRVYNLLNKKYRRQFTPLIKRKEKVPTVFGTLKVDDNITLYALPVGLYMDKTDIMFKALDCFLIMKDLRKQTRIMINDVPNNNTFGVVYDTHAISRYKERLGLDEDMDFVDVCKHMVDIGLCGSPRIIIPDWNMIHGSDTNNREGRLTCANGVFLGYYSVDRYMFYASTFLSPNELTDRQEVYDPTRGESAQMWIEHIKKIKSGEIQFDKDKLTSYEENVALIDGEIKLLTKSESKEMIEKLDTMCQENPEFYQAQIQANKEKAMNRIKRKGYK